MSGSSGDEGANVKSPLASISLVSATSREVVKLWKDKENCLISGAKKYKYLRI